jgi:hypothetical protein
VGSGGDPVAAPEDGAAADVAALDAAPGAWPSGAVTGGSAERAGQDAVATPADAATSRGAAAVEGGGAASPAGAEGELADGGPAIGSSTWRPIERPQFGQKRSSPLWIAAQRGQAVIPASRRTVTVSRSPNAVSSVRSSASMCPSVFSLLSTSASLRWPNRWRLKTSPPRSR